jgi:hypothetical protein
LINRIKLFGSTTDVGFDFCLAQIGPNLFDHPFDEGLPFGTAIAHQGFNFDVELRIQHREGQVLQLRFNRLNTHPVR